MANLNVNEIKRLILVSFPFLFKLFCEEIDKNNILTKMKLSPFSKSKKKNQLKRVVRLDYL